MSIWNLKEMQIINKGALDKFKRKHADVRSQVESWVAEVELAEWDKPADVKARYPKASILVNNQVMFDLKGNAYRLWTKINYKNRIVLVKDVDTHEEYMKWQVK